MSDHSSTAPTSNRTGAWRVFVNVLAALGVLLIGASAMALSYFAFYERAIEAGVADPFTYLYPGVFALLLLLCFMASYVLRGGKWLHRISAEFLILLLIATGLLAAIEDQLPVTMDARTESIVFSTAPWVALLLGVLVARWIDIELRVRRRTAPTAAPSPAATSPEPAREPAPQADSEETVTDIGWLTNQLRPEDDEGGNTSTAEAPTSEPETKSAPEPAIGPSRAPSEAPSEEQPAGSETEPAPMPKTAQTPATPATPESAPSTDEADPATADTDPAPGAAAAEAGAVTGKSRKAKRSKRAQRGRRTDTTQSTPAAADAETPTEPLGTIRPEGESGGQDTTGQVPTDSDGSADTDEVTAADPAAAPAPAEDQSAAESADTESERPAEEAVSAVGPTTTRPQRAEKDDAEELPPLPKRTPGESAHQPRRLAPLPAPLADDAYTTRIAESDDETPVGDPQGAPAPAPSSSYEEGLTTRSFVDPVDEGFVPDAPSDDPTTDESTPAVRIAARDEDSETGSAASLEPDTSSGASMATDVDATDSRAAGSPAADAAADESGVAAVELPSRPLVRRPRRGSIADFPPTQPPSGQVRSGPTPPDPE